MVGELLPSEETFSGVYLFGMTPFDSVNDDRWRRRDKRQPVVTAETSNGMQT